MKKSKTKEKDILSYIIGLAIIIASEGIIILLCLLPKERLATLAIPIFTLPKVIFCLLCTLCALPQSYILGKSLALKQMPIFYALTLAHIALAVWALLFYFGLILSALIIVCVSAITLNVICFRLTNKKGVRWLLALPYTLWVLYVLFLNYAIVLLN